MNFSIRDESGMTQAELEIYALALAKYMGPLAPWGFGECKFSIGGDDVPIYITKRNRKLGIAGYHTVENGNKPVIYIAPRTDRFGFFKAGKPAVPAVPARKIGAITLRARPAVAARPAQIRGGQLATVAHEVAEVLGDPLIATYSNPDALGHKYLREITDPMHGLYYREVINGVDCILPINVLPNWYELDSQGPYDTAGWSKAPFQKAPRGYAFWVDKFGKFFKV